MKLFTLTFSGINFVADQCKVITTSSCDITEQIMLFVDLKKKKKLVCKEKCHNMIIFQLKSFKSNYCESFKTKAVIDTNGNHILEDPYEKYMFTLNST